MVQIQQRKVTENKANQFVLRLYNFFQEKSLGASLKQLLETVSKAADDYFSPT